jgi:[ribosomal protein S5]-alanine N-acetyltransferase
MCLKTERLVLRRFSHDDWRDLYEYLSQDNVVKYEPYDILSEEACKNEAVKRSQNDAFWAVCLKDDNKLIGNVYFRQQEPKEFLTWEIGYVFNPLFWGKGYATEASNRILQYGFEELGAHRIIGKCNPENTASWKLLERMSMRREGIYKKPAYFRKSPDGKSI